MLGTMLAFMPLRICTQAQPTDWPEWQCCLSCWDGVKRSASLGLNVVCDGPQQALCRGAVEHAQREASVFVAKNWKMDSMQRALMSSQDRKPSA